jgi:N utilization substance protein B
MSSRRRSRERALQVLFLWEASKLPADDALDAFDEIARGGQVQAPPREDAFTRELVHGTVEHVAALDERIARHAAHWRLERMPAVDRNLLRLAVYEMLHAGTPPPVVIDEALELARRFAGEESVQFVNGVLDAIRKESTS